MRFIIEMFAQGVYRERKGGEGGKVAGNSSSQGQVATQKISGNVKSY